jgi:hypothetical protein
MKNLQRMFMAIVSEFVQDYSVEELFEELFPGRPLEEIVYEMYESGMVPEDRMEKFLQDE